MPLPALALSEADYARTNRELTLTVALPAAAGLASATSSLESEVSTFCDQPAAAARPAVDQAFAAAMAAWQRLRPLGFGPLMAGNGPARFQHWPDRRGTGARQLARTLSRKDPSVLDPAGLAAKSVALGDLQALERLLTDQGEPIEADAYRCSFAVSIATLLADRAAALDAAWQPADGYAALILSAALGNDAYFDAAEATRDYLDALGHGLEEAAARKLRPVLGAGLEAARPRAAESWRSGLSAANIAANLATLRALVEGEDGLGGLAAAGGDPLIGRTLAAMLEEAQRALEALPVPLAQAVSDPVLRPGLEAAADLVERAHALTLGPLATALGLTSGFNASDGD